MTKKRKTEPPQLEAAESEVTARVDLAERAQTASQPVEVVAASPMPDGYVAITEGLDVILRAGGRATARDEALAIIDEYVARIGYGGAVKLDALLELRERVSKL